MKYNAHIYCAGCGFDLPSAAVVLLCKQKLLNRLSITYDHRLRKHCILSDPLTLPRGRLTGVKLGQEIHREYDFHSLHCVYRDRLLIFSHILYWENIWEPCGDRVIKDRVIVESQCTRSNRVHNQHLSQIHHNLPKQLRPRHCCVFE